MCLPCTVSDFIEKFELENNFPVTDLSDTICNSYLIDGEYENSHYIDKMEGSFCLMREYIQLLLWIIFLYYWSWFYTEWRRESALIIINKSLAKMLFYIKSPNRISLVSIIMGLFAHISLIFFLILIPLNDVVALYMKLIVRIWIWLGISLGTIGETIETYIKMKRAKAVSKKREFQILTILLVFVAGFMICMTVKYSLDISKLFNDVREKPVENLIISEEEITDAVYYLRDEKIDEIAAFSDFLDGQVSAYDHKQQKELYCIDYYEKFMEEHLGISAIEIAAEDINEDGKCELLIILMYTPDQGDLYVFHEQDGRVYAWEVLENFFTMRVGEVYLLENGTFEFFGGYGQGHFFKRYNADGEIEDVLNYYYNSYPYEGEIQYDYVLTTYEQGVPTRELKYSMIAPADKLPDEGELSSGTREEQEECNRILDEFCAKSERVRWFKFPQNEDDVEEIPLDNVLKR